nr:hypothetical protein [Candidatus Sigynarchaeota archaeon]
TTQGNMNLINDRPTEQKRQKMKSGGCSLLHVPGRFSAFGLRLELAEIVEKENSRRNQTQSSNHTDVNRRNGGTLPGIHHQQKQRNR